MPGLAKCICVINGFKTRVLETWRKCPHHELTHPLPPLSFGKEGFFFYFFNPLCAAERVDKR
jgi:hypothetical protein